MHTCHWDSYSFPGCKQSTCPAFKYYTAPDHKQSTCISCPCISSSIHQAKPLEALRTNVAELQASGRAKDAEIRKLQELADATQELYAGDAQAAKIIDLSKKDCARLLSGCSNSCHVLGHLCQHCAGSCPVAPLLCCKIVPCPCVAIVQNRALLLSLEKERQKSAELQSLLKSSPSAPKAPPEPQDPDVGMVQIGAVPLDYECLVAVSKRRALAFPALHSQQNILLGEAEREGRHQSPARGCGEHFFEYG
eukprot:1152828-Pelagomonas_calceolata.AAC.2